MRRPSLATKTLRRVTSDQRGAILVIMTAAVLLFTLLFAGLAEYGRVLIVREQLQTAADAASLGASISGVHRWVRITVTTDRGEEEHCTSDGNGGTTCTCDPCGETSVTVVGDERRLLDEGGWRDFVMPYCSCGGGDEWFEIRDRWVTYDVTSASWGTDPGEIDRIENEITNAAREALAYKSRHYGDTMRVLGGANLKRMAALVNNYDDWMDAWQRENCGEYCWDECRWYGWSECSYECRECLQSGEDAFDNLREKRQWINQLARRMDEIRAANEQEGIPDMPMTADDTASSLFAANQPEQAETSWISRLKVHGLGDPFYPSVTVYGSGWVRSLLTADIASLFGQKIFPDRYRVDVCGQGDTFYRDPTTQKGRHTGSLNDVGKWIKPPPDACWEDLQ